jgi:hypothetical protein
MTSDELATIFTATFGTADALRAKLAMLDALLGVEVANAGALIAQAQGQAALNAAEVLRQQAQAEAEAAKTMFAQLVAAAAVG